MKSINIVTTFGQQNDHKMGREFVDNFIKYWPKEVTLYALHEGRFENQQTENIIYQDLFTYKPCIDFLERYREDKVPQGEQPHAWFAWHPDEIKHNYSYRYDAYKFCRKVFAMNCVAQQLKDDSYLFWVDADIVTKKNIPLEVFANEFGLEGHFISYLARNGRYTETGFIGFNLYYHPACKLLAKMEQTYTYNRFLYYAQWHDCFIFDVLADAIIDIQYHYKIPSDFGLHPFESCPLSPYATHLKGNQK